MSSGEPSLRLVNRQSGSTLAADGEAPVGRSPEGGTRLAAEVKQYLRMAA